MYKNHYPHVVFQKDGSFKAIKENKPHEPGFFGQTLKNASNKIMSLPAIKRNKITLGMMSIAQLLLGKGTPINREKMKLSLIFSASLKTVKYSLLGAFQTLVQRISKQPEKVALPDNNINVSPVNHVNQDKGSILVARENFKLQDTEKLSVERDTLSMKELKGMVNSSRNSIDKKDLTIKVKDRIPNER